jgi:agmatine deiminase
METEITPRGAAVGRTPRADGLRLPARFGEHSRTLLSWPCRGEAFGPLMRQAREEWAEVARAIARFEAVTVIARPEALTEVRALC